MNLKQRKEATEILCVERFNKIGSFCYSNIRKNEVQNHIDVFADDVNGNTIKFQITKADGQHFGEIGKNINDETNNGKMYLRDNSSINRIHSAITKKIDLYKTQNVNMSETILLLDDIGDIPPILLGEIYGTSSFREVYYVGSSTIFKIRK